MSQARRCTAKRSNGQPCKRWAIKGAMVCTAHGAAAPQVRAKAAVVAEVQAWGLGDSTIDPGETLLRLLTQSVARAEGYAAELAAEVDRQGGSLADALTGESLILNPNNGNLQKVGEYVRAMAMLEAQERDRAAKFAAQAIAAGLAERQVRLAERQGVLIEQVITAAFERLDLSVEQRRAAPAAIRAALAAVS